MNVSDPTATDVDADAHTGLIRSLSLDGVLSRRDIIVERLTCAHKALVKAEKEAKSFDALAAHQADR